MGAIYPTSTACATYKTLFIVFTTPEIPPYNGYKVKWKVATDTTWTVEPNQFNNPISIPNVPACNSLQVSIQADCGNGSTGQEIIVAVPGVNSTCYSFTLNDLGTYTYTACGSSTPSTVVNSSTTSPTVVCAVDGSVSGGSFTRGNQCGAGYNNAGITFTNLTGSTVSFTASSSPWFTITTGNISNLTAGNSAIGTHGAFSGNWSVTLAGVTTGCLVLRKNEGTPIATVAVNGAGTYTFNNIDILASDEIVLFYNTACP